MNDLRNPYIAGAPVVETSMFFGREDVFHWIENSLTGKFVDHILVLHGQRRVGKTTVLKQIPNFLSKQYIQVFYDLQGRTSTTLGRFLWWMASEMVRTVNKQLNTDLPRPNRDQFSDSDAFITGFIPNLQPILGDHTLLLTFDEFDTLARADIQDSFARPLISFLRHLFDIEGLNFIFSIGSSGNKLENMQASYTDFFKTALYRKVSFLSKNECRSLITKPVEGVITYQPKAIQRITQITSGHPYFTQLMCHELFSRCQTTGSREITPEDVDGILDDVIERGTVNLKFVWDEATDLEKWVLAVLGEKEGVSQKEISTTLKSQGVRFVDSDLNSAILHLRDKDVLTKDNHLLIHLMKLWLESNRPMDRVREELVQTNPIADRYIEIGDEYRDREQWEQAISSYQQALSVQANNLTALVNIAGIQLEQSAFQQAAAAFDKALQVDSEHIAARQGYCQAQLALGDQARQIGDVDDAIAAYQAILNLTPVHRQARQNLAAIYREQAETHLSAGDDQQALESLRLAIEMTPEDEELKARHQGIIDEKKAALVKSWFDKAQRALRRKRWDEAVKMAQEALKVDPEDQTIQKRLAAIKDAPRQEKLKAYRQEAETAITKGDYTKAFAALETASLLAPEDPALKDWLASTREDQQHAKLKHYQTQAENAQAAGDWDAAITARQAALELDPENKTLIQALTQTQAAQKDSQLKHYQTLVEKAQAAGDWDAAITARQAALELDPENETLAQALVETQAAQHQEQLDGLRTEARQARQDERWEDAISAAQALLKLIPDDQAAKSELDAIRTAQRQAKLDRLLAKGDNDFKVENWSEAVSAWETYLEEVPEDAEKFSERLAHARKYAQISADYTEAQEHIHKKQFGRAISKLQGVITQDPTYKATSRLLTEAVEGSRQRAPIWKSPWLFGGAGVILVVILGLVFGQHILSFFASKPWEGLLDRVARQEDRASTTIDDNEVQNTGETATVVEAESEPTPTPGTVGINEKDSAEIVYVLEGEFLMGSEDGDSDESPEHTVYLDAYWIYKHEVTNAQFATFIAETGYTTDAEKKGWSNVYESGSWEQTSGAYWAESQGPGSDVDRLENYPVIHVSWNDANAYCEWAGGRLPTEAEWEKAARGEDGRTYPWGNTPVTGLKANYCDENCGLDWKDSSQDDGYAQTAPVGSFPAGANPNGALDMAGNVWEWVADWYDADYYASSPGTNPSGPGSGDYRVLRGGSWWGSGRYLRTSDRVRNDPGNADDSYGFRCIIEADENDDQAEPEPETEQVIQTPSPGTADTNERDGAEMVYVPAGEFLMGNEEGYRDVSPEHTVFLDAFWIYKHEVTNELYRSCIAAGECTGSLEDYPENDYPAVYINCRKANDYCIWAGGRLPTEAEWEKAARGVDGREYPWGNEDPPHSLAQWGSSGPVPVGSYPAGASPYGALNMAGNVSEWVADWYDEYYYSYSPKDNPLGPFDSTERIVRGGDWGKYYAEYVNSYLRWRNDPNFTSQYIGFRCIIEADENDYVVEAEPETTPAPDWVTDFAQPILDEIANVPPTFQDDFSTLSDAWDLTTPGSYKASIENNELLSHRGVKNQAITYHDYVLEVDLRIVDNEPDTYGIGFTNGSAVSCGFEIDNYFQRDFAVKISCSGDIHSSPVLSNYPQSLRNYKLRLIVKGPNMAFYINNEPVHYINMESFSLYRGSKPVIELDAGAFSNFKVWNITNIDIP